MRLVFALLKKTITHPFTAVIGRLVLGIVFVYASWDKILHPEAFSQAVQNYRIVPLAAVNLFALVLPWVELICGFLLLLGLFTGGSSLLVSLLLVLFLVALSSALIRGIDISCGCFSQKSSSPITYWYLLRDTALLLVALQVLIFDRDVASLSGLRKRRQ